MAAFAAHGVVREAGEDLETLRARRPEIHVLTSPVAQKLSADALLALGAEVSMSQAPGEIEAFAERADALLVNLGMLDDARRDAAARALPIITDRGAAWALDPVKVERSPRRADYAQDLVSSFRPTLLRANASEGALAREWRPQCGAIAITGPRDVIQAKDGRALALANGSSLATRATAIGCCAGAVMAAFAAICPDPFRAAISALSTMGVAIEIAASRSQGPGGFQPALLDTLYAMDGATLAQFAAIEAVEP